VIIHFLAVLVIDNLKNALRREVENIRQVGYAFTIGVPSANNFIPFNGYYRSNSTKFKQPLSDAGQ
jgi:hypothetical protein